MNMIRISDARTVNSASIVALSSIGDRTEDIHRFAVAAAICGHAGDIRVIKDVPKVQLSAPAVQGRIHHAEIVGSNEVEQSYGSSIEDDSTRNVGASDIAYAATEPQAGNSEQAYVIRAWACRRSDGSSSWRMKTASSNDWSPT